MKPLIVAVVAVVLAADAVGDAVGDAVVDVDFEFDYDDGRVDVHVEAHVTPMWVVAEDVDERVMAERILDAQWERKTVGAEVMTEVGR